MYLPLILVSMVFNYSLGRSLAKGDKHKNISRKQLLTVGIVGNVILLGYFKYSDFFINNVNAVFSANIPALHLALPLAISFFTFQQIAYLVDSYRNETNEYDFLNYGVFISFFPQLIAGPIVHHKEMMPQFANVKNKIIRYNHIAIGLFLFSMGLFKKVIIADTFSVWATDGFDGSSALSFFEAWKTSLSYTFQLYFDFSGYTDMAFGAAYLFNIKLPQNFNSPYKASNIQDFWRRWHVTLSRFLRDYIYIPLGGNRKGDIKTYSNLLITFLIGGLWHGAGWTFVFWGFIHGVALVLQRIWSQHGFKMNSFMGKFITFNFVNIAWVFFRAKEWDDAIKVLRGMVDFSSVNSSIVLKDLYQLYGKGYRVFGSSHAIEALIIAFVIVFLAKNSNELALYMEDTKRRGRLAWISAFCLGASLMSMSFMKGSEFLYFNF